MKAIVWTEMNRVELRGDVADPLPEDDEIVVRVKAAGVCSTDLHMIRGNLGFAKPPWILGHELSGVVHTVGARACGFRAGDRVVVDPVIGCGFCSACLSGKKHLCKEGGEIGTTYGSGGYGQFVKVKPGNLYVLPPELTFAEGAMMEPLNCTLGAIERVGSMAGSRVVVYGAGPAGLLFVQLAKAFGAGSVALVGTTETSLALGRLLGADYTVNVTAGSEELPESSCDIAIEAAGSVRAVEDCMRVVAPGGTLVLYGLSGSGKPNLDADRIIGKDLTVVTCISAPLLWGKCLKLVRSGRVDVKSIVTETAHFEEAARLINAMVGRTWSTIKLLIVL